ncbi:LRP4-like protein [Mya arenaria]|uniref:LRP4-like protein n=1 Tax=Mya arenaria TaxID=6604 RepID=A0ABY7DJN4_MYAAR|nr:LRP4-like protein [Mya arenaria]
MDMATQGYVKIISLNPTLANPVAVDYDNEHQHVYFTDVQAKLIMQTDIILESSVPDGMAIDAGARLLFYTDTGTNVISVVDLDSHRQTTVIAITV